jgi:hypothetical protein
MGWLNAARSPLKTASEIPSHNSASLYRTIGIDKRFIHPIETPSFPIRALRVLKVGFGWSTRFRISRHLAYLFMMIGMNTDDFQRNAS